MLPLQGAWVRSLVGELRSRMLRGMAKNKKKKYVYKHKRNTEKCVKIIESRYKVYGGIHCITPSSFCIFHNKMSGMRREGTNDQCQNVPEKFRRWGQITDSEFGVWTLGFGKGRRRENGR